MEDFNEINLISGSHNKKEIFIKNYLEHLNITDVSLILYPETQIPCSSVLEHMENIISKHLITSSNRLIIITDNPFVSNAVTVIARYLEMRDKLNFYNIDLDENDISSCYDKAMFDNVFSDAFNDIARYPSEKQKMLDLVLYYKNNLIKENK